MPWKKDEKKDSEAAEPIVEDLTTPEAILYLEDVPDWEDRMNRANYTEEQRYMIK
jgi:hypothetical protein